MVPFRVLSSQHFNLLADGSRCLWPEKNERPGRIEWAKLILSIETTNHSSDFCGVAQDSWRNLKLQKRRNTRSCRWIRFRCVTAVRDETIIEYVVRKKDFKGENIFRKERARYAIDSWKEIAMIFQDPTRHWPTMKIGKQLQKWLLSTRKPKEGQTLKNC